MQMFQWAASYGKWCSRSLTTGRYTSTPAVARDMLTYIKSTGQSKLNYVGVSYGTVLGATFASLFPDHVGKFVLDGVADSEDIYNNLWARNLMHTDEAVQYFFDTCYQVGPTLCPFYESSPQAISRRFQNIVNSLAEAPIPVSDNSTLLMPELAYYSDLKQILLSVVYTPLEDFPLLAQILVDLEKGNGSSLVASAGAVVGYDPSQTYNSNAGWEIPLIILCADGAGRHNITTFQELETYVNLLQSQSRYVGDTWGHVSLSCRDLDVTPPQSGIVDGNYIQLSKYELMIFCLASSFSTTAKYNTSTPILFIGSTTDPVTPREK
jgi:pimeloyl-ACP methyl ester carboxylesterase